MKISLLSLLFVLMSHLALGWQETTEQVPSPSREFRAAWVATIYNIDWPSRTGLSADAQKAEFQSIINKAVELKLNAIILQVRPQFDALYQSHLEPWSQWLTGTQGASPGYDPLHTFCEMAHNNGIEIHAWFNPFRAAANPGHKTAGNHVTQRYPQLIRSAGGQVWVDPGDPQAAALALNTILDVTKRYDIDGIHLDDYFYPYPYSGQKWSPHQFNDQQTFNRHGSGSKTEWRRKNIDNFVQNLYKQVKREKPWVRVGISPFGIWRPGVPSSIEAGIDAYEQLAADSRKWLANGWLDYLAPQLYWRCEPAKQSFPTLLQWWRNQSSSRPVFPGIASARIKSSEDPGRPASEIIRQINYSRQIGKKQNGMCFWSMKSLMQNKDGINNQLKNVFTAPALTPPMPWSGSLTPAKPEIFISEKGDGINLFWKANDGNARKWVIQAKYGSKWRTLTVCPAKQNRITLNISAPDAVSVRAISPYGDAGIPAVLRR